MPCDDQATYWELSKAGCCIGATQLHLGLEADGRVHLLRDLPLENLPLWLLAAKALRQPRASAGFMICCPPPSNRSAMLDDCHLKRYPKGEHF